MMNNPTKTLILRLSSLGDVVLATAVLETEHCRGGVDWVVAQEYATLLQGHPSIRRLWVFDRKSGLRGWLSLSRQLWVEKYDSVIDLHGSLRTRLLRVLFLLWGMRQKLFFWGQSQMWLCAPRLRWRLWGFYGLKSLWPKNLRPEMRWRAFVRTVGGDEKARPSLKHLLKAGDEAIKDVSELAGLPKKYLCVMPSSRWAGKCWDVKKYAEVLRELPLLPVILGASGDKASQELVRLLQKENVPHVSGVGRWDLLQVAQVLAHSQGYLGGDTGLAHMAEAVGVSAFMLFGPTVPEMGFGPWRGESRAIGAPLWCRPCGKDGRACFRLWSRHWCLEILKPSLVLDVVSQMVRAPIQSEKVLFSSQKNKNCAGISQSEKIPMSQSKKNPSPSLGKRASTLRLRAYRLLLKGIGILMGRHQSRVFIERSGEQSSGKKYLWSLDKRFEEQSLGKKHLWFTDKHSEEQGSDRKCLWFHAASAGELESLWNVILAALNDPIDIVVTVFSPSAWKSLERLKVESMGRVGQIVFADYSPWEGNWHLALQQVLPSCFITAKYEAWPELWASLAELKIPLVILGVRKRRSLLLAKWICRILGAPLPTLLLFTADEMDQEGLGQMFPEAKIQMTGECRWDRVFGRAQKGHPRPQELLQRFGSLPRPWGILGQIWKEDLKVWAENFQNCLGTLWVVPHQIDLANVQRLEFLMKQNGLKVFNSQNQEQESEVREGSQPVCVMVPEMGFLSELYAIMDFAFVGGGFGKGVHSTIEPAIHGLPVAIGPRGADRFSEIKELKSTGQLTIVSDGRELGSWLNRIVCSVSPQQSSHSQELAFGSHSGDLNQLKTLWRTQAEARRGATQKIYTALLLELSREP